jgi:hypothetical protein
MHSATRLDDLKILECFLQNALHAHLGRIIPFRVQCLYKDDTLWVLAQHPADVVIDIPDIFGVLERTLQAEEPKTPLAVKLYLRAEGNQRPYSQQGFTVYPAVKQNLPGEAAPAMTAMSEDLIVLERDLLVGRSHPGSEHNSDRSNRSNFTPPIIPGSELPHQQEDLQSLDHDFGTTTDRIEVTPKPTAGLIHQKRLVDDPPDNQLVKVDADAIVANVDRPVGDIDKHNDSSNPPGSKRKGKMILPILGGLGLLAIGSGAAYMGTRPCVFQTCTELSTSTQLTQSSVAVLNHPNVTGQEVLAAQKQLHQSVANLNSIPSWSTSHDSAQQYLQATKSQVTDLDTTVEAMNKAFKATSIVKTPPIAIDRWHESKRLWTESIASLRIVPPNSKIYALAQQKLKTYQARLADTERRIEVETTAQEQLKSALDNMKAAAQAQSTAKSLTEWRGIKAQWDRASDRLKGIATNTSAYPEAQVQLKSVQPQITAAQTKVVAEEKAIQNYTAAVNLAQSAKLAQQNNKLSQAVGQWNQSIAMMQSIPQHSAVYGQAKPLAAEYTKNFQQVNAQLKNNKTVAVANKDLQKTCGGNPQICTYTVTNKGIVVRLMSLYTQTIMQTAMAASTQGDGTAKVGIVNHVNTLGNALQTISDNAKLPLEVYGANGKQIQNYRP